MGSIQDSFLNDGAVSPRTRGEVVYNDSGGTLNPGDLVTFTGHYEPSAVGEKRCRRVKKADADGNDLPAQAVVRTTILSGSQGRVYATYRLTDQNTNSASAVDDPVYLSTTAGSWTLTDPGPTENIRTQIVGRVAAKSATVGVVEFNVAEPQSRGRAPIPSGTLTALVVANVASQAAGAIAAAGVGIPVTLELVVPAGATGNVDFTGVPYKVRVRNVRGYKTNAAGGGGGTLQVCNGTVATPITDAISIDVADKTVLAAGTIDDANNTIAAAATIRVVRTRTASTDESAVLYLDCVRSA